MFLCILSFLLFPPDSHQDPDSNVSLSKTKNEIKWKINTWKDKNKGKKVKDNYANKMIQVNDTFFFCLGFLTRTFTNHRTAGKREGDFFNSSLPLPPAHRHLGISWAITAECLPLRIASSWTRTGKLWFPSASS